MAQVPTKPGEEILIKFLERTKKGEYAPIEESSLQYVRTLAAEAAMEETFYFGLS